MFCLLAVARADGPVGARELELIARLVETPETGDMASLALARELLGAETGWKAGLCWYARHWMRRRAQAYALAADFVMLNAKFRRKNAPARYIGGKFPPRPADARGHRHRRQIRLAPKLTPELGHHD